MKNSFSRLLPWIAGVGAVLVAMFVVQMLGIRMNLSPLGTRMANKGFGGGMASVTGESMMIGREIYPQPMPPDYFPPTDDVTTKDRSIVRSASMELGVDDVGAKVSEATSYVASINGLVTNSSVNKYEKTVVGSMQIRVPETKFDEAVAWLQQNVKEVISLSVSSYDQTGQVVKTKNRLEDLKVQEAEYQQLLDEAQTTADKLRLQRQLEQIRLQISNWQDQEQQMENQAAMSSIYVSYRKQTFKLPAIGSLDFSSVVQQALDTLVLMVQLLITLAIWTVIFIPLWLPTVLIVKRLQKKQV